jgi:superfamily I DNA and RNA helicase
MALDLLGVKCWQPGSEQRSTDFRREGRVTLAKLHYAKGNEAWKVYVTRFQNAVAGPGGVEDEVCRRNKAFVALTRSRAWCVVTGQEALAFDELRRADAMWPELVFPAFNRRTKFRVLDDEELPATTAES